MIAFYVLFLIFLGMVAYAGLDATIRLVVYVDILFRTRIIEIKLWFLERKLRKGLNLPKKSI